VATVEVSDAEIRVRFSRWEKVAGPIRDIRVPRTAVVEATVEPDGVRAVHGIRAPGLGLPRRRIGTWRERGRRTAVSVTAGLPAVRITLRGATFDELLIGDADAARTAEALQVGATRP
jgi:hypothetical protein